VPIGRILRKVTVELGGMGSGRVEARCHLPDLSKEQLGGLFHLKKVAEPVFRESNVKLLRHCSRAMFEKASNGSDFANFSWKDSRKSVDGGRLNREK